MKNLLVLSFALLVMTMVGCNSNHRSEKEQIENTTGGSALYSTRENYKGEWIYQDTILKENTRLKIYRQGNAELLEITSKTMDGHNRTEKISLHRDVNDDLYFEGDDGKVHIVYDYQNDMLIIPDLGEFRRAK